MGSTSTVRRNRNTSYKRRRGTQKNNSEPGFKEKLIMQCIISGFIFLAVLILTLIKTDITNDASAKLKSAITTNMSTEDLNGYFLTIKNTVTTIFGYQAPEETNVKNGEDMTSGGGEISGLEGAEQNFRIDEDILALMNAEDNVYLRNAIGRQN